MKSRILTLNSGNLRAQNEVVNNASANNVVIENNVNLIQRVATTLNDNLGAITIKRNCSLLKRLDYTIWLFADNKSPNQFLKTFSPLTLEERFYNYNETTNLHNAVITPDHLLTIVFEKRTAYLIRLPNTADSAVLSAYTAVFNGLPKNGTITKAVYYLDATLGYNMIENLYP